MSEVKLVVDGAKMAEVLRGRDGPVAEHMIERATVFQVAAKAQAPRKTGCLQDSIVKRVEDLDGDIAIRVISDTSPCSPTHTSYSEYVHEGTQPHVIMPSGRRRVRTSKDGKRSIVAPAMLAFYWANGPDGAKTYFFTKVNHPGTKPNKFFTDNLHIFGE